MPFEASFWTDMDPSHPGSVYGAPSSACHRHKLERTRVWLDRWNSVFPSEPRRQRNMRKQSSEWFRKFSSGVCCETHQNKIINTIRIFGYRLRLLFNSWFRFPQRSGLVTTVGCYNTISAKHHCNVSRLLHSVSVEVKSIYEIQMCFVDRDFLNRSAYARIRSVDSPSPTIKMPEDFF